MARRVLWGFAPVLIIGAVLWRERFSGYHERVAERHFALSEYYAHQGDVEGARREMAVALKEDPQYAEARDGLATIYSTNGDPTEAVRLYREGIKLQPRTLSLRYDLAELYFSERQFDRAIPPLEDAIKVDPDFLPGLRLLGISYEKAGRQADARRLWQESSRQHPEDPTFSHSLARLERQMKGRARAGQIREAARQTAPDRDNKP